MCGICGFVGDKEEKKTILSEMMSAIRHRGPDNEGIYQDEEISFGFCRLSIIDMKTGNQPMFNEDRTKCLIFNGEIYNYGNCGKNCKRRGMYSLQDRIQKYCCMGMRNTERIYY